METDPLRAVSLVYEEQLSAIKNSLEPGSMEETEFEALVPNFLRTKNDVFVLNKVKNGPKWPYNRPKRAKNV